MYLYLYDHFLNDKKYSTMLARIETRLTDLGIGGKIFRLSPLRNIVQLVADEVRAGAKTVVCVGNDKTFSQILNVAAPLDITVGIIPIGGENKIAGALGITSAENGCAVLAARKIERVDLGKVNDTYFLSSLSVAGDNITIECEDQYRLQPQSAQRINICNLRPLAASGFGGTNFFNPKDGLLEILIQPMTHSFWGFGQRQQSAANSIIPFKKITIRSRGSVSITTDGRKVLKTPLEIHVVPKKLKIIVGKNRFFT